MAKSVSYRRVLALILTIIFLVSLALPASVRAADGSVAPRLAWWDGGSGIDFSPDGELAAVVQHTNLQVRRAATGEVVAEAMAVRPDVSHSDIVRYQATWSPAGDQIAIAVADTRSGDPYTQIVSVWAWGGRDLRFERNITIADIRPNVIAWSPVGTLFASGPTIVDAATGDIVATLDLTGIKDGPCGVNVGSVRWSPTGDVLFLADACGIDLMAWNVWAGGIVWYRDDLPVDWGAFNVSPDGVHLATLLHGGILRILNASTGEVVATRTPADVGLDRGFAFGVAWSSDGRVLYVGGGEAFGTLLTYPSLDLLAVLPPASKNDDWASADRVTFSSDDRLLALGNTPYEVYVFELTPESPVLLAGGILIAGGGAAAVGYGWRRRRRGNTTTEEGEP
jgi:WD40 repeat protein